MSDESTLTNVDDDHQDNGELLLSPQNVVDKVAFGRRLRALRVLNGYDRVQEFTHVLRSRFGVDVSDRTVYAIERGEQMPHLDFFIGCLATFDQPYDYFWPAIRTDVIEVIKKRGQS